MEFSQLFNGSGKTFKQVPYNIERAFLNNPVVFHVMEDNKLIILGALSVTEYGDCLYLDCEPDKE